MPQSLEARRRRPAPPAGGGRGGSQTLGDFQTVQRLDNPTPPQITASDEFYEFLFSGSGQSYADYKAKADKQEPLPPVVLKDVSITIDVDATYDIVQTRLTRNVVGIVEGTDPHLKDTYVLFGAHYDHIGYLEMATRQRIRRRRHQRRRLHGSGARDAARRRHHQQRCRR